MVSGGLFFYHPHNQHRASQIGIRKITVLLQIMILTICHVGGAEFFPDFNNLWGCFSKNIFCQGYNENVGLNHLNPSKYSGWNQYPG